LRSRTHQLAVDGTVDTRHYSAPLTRAAASLLTPEFGRALRRSWILVGLATAVFAWLWTLSFGTSTDSFAYWSVDLAHPWLLNEGDLVAFTYSPVAALLFAPFHALPYPVFFVGWTTLLALVALWLCPPMLWAPGFLLLLGELHAGNVHILMAAAIVLGLTRAAGWWSVPLLLKVTPGVGILWFLVRREWRKFATALIVSGVLVLASLVVDASLWPQWFDFLVRNIGGPAAGGFRLELPLLPRVAIAAAVVLFAAWSDRAWLVPIAAVVALPVLWLAAIPAFVLASARLSPRSPSESASGRTCAS
jgi:hypothetical protein